MFSKILFIVLIAGASAAATGALITFKTKECESIALVRGASVMGTTMKMYSALGIMYVNMDASEVKAMAHANSEFSDCILDVV